MLSAFSTEQLKAGMIVPVPTQFSIRAAQNTANRLDFTSWANAGAIKIQLLHRLFARAARE
jgi:hypothetical protein